MDLFGEKIGYYNRNNTGLLNKNTIDNRGIEAINYINYSINERTAFKTNSELYARELIKRNGISDQNEIYKNRMYDKYTKNNNKKITYLRLKEEQLETIAYDLRDDFKLSYMKALNEGYSQSAAEKIAQEKTDKKKKIKMDEFHQTYPF